MTIKELKEKIKSYPNDLMPFCIEDVFSWRGVYAEPACSLSTNLVPKEHNISMLERLETETFDGYKGGQYTYEEGDELNFEPFSDAYTDGHYILNFIIKNAANNEAVQFLFSEDSVDGEDEPNILDSRRIKDAEKAPITCLEYVLENADLSEFTRDLLNDCEYALDDMENISKGELESIADRYINENSDVIYVDNAENYIRLHGGYKRAVQIMRAYGYDMYAADDVELVASLMCMEDHRSDWNKDIDSIMSCIEDYVDEDWTDED